MLTGVPDSPLSHKLSIIKLYRAHDIPACVVLYSRNHTSPAKVHEYMAHAESITHAANQECLQAWRKANKIICFLAWWKEHAVNMHPAAPAT